MQILGNGGEPPEGFNPVKDFGMPLPVNLAGLDPDQEAQMAVIVASLEKAVNHINAKAKKVDEIDWAAYLARHDGDEEAAAKAVYADYPDLAADEPLLRLEQAVSKGVLVPLTLCMTIGMSANDAITKIVGSLTKMLFLGGVEYGKHLSLGAVPNDVKEERTRGHEDRAEGEEQHD